MQLSSHLHQAISTCEEILLRLQCCPFYQLFDLLEVFACYARPPHPKQDAVQMTTVSHFSVAASGGPVSFSYQDPDILSRPYSTEVLWCVMKRSCRYQIPGWESSTSPLSFLFNAYI